MTKSTITRERLQEIAEDGFLKHGESKELARMALAAMDSEPVAWTDEEELRDVNVAGIGYLFGIDREANKFSDPRRQIMLYRHAQQPVVMDDLSIFEAAIEKCKTCDSIDEHAWNHGVLAVMAKYDACRAAMLQAGTFTNEGTIQVVNSPVIPGWIPVSERMPEPGILVLVYTPPQPGDYPGDVRIGFDYIDPDGDDPTYWFNHGENYEHFCCVACDGMTGPSEKALYTHWIPLPAAPQEAK